MYEVLIYISVYLLPKKTKNKNKKHVEIKFSAHDAFLE
jgi:hypothetical protein